jgi:hypothetical protein
VFSRPGLTHCASTRVKVFPARDAMKRPHDRREAQLTFTAWQSTSLAAGHNGLLRYQGPEQRSREGAHTRSRVQHGAGSHSVLIRPYHRPSITQHASRVVVGIAAPVRIRRLRSRQDRTASGPAAAGHRGGPLEITRIAPPAFGSDRRGFAVGCQPRDSCSCSGMRRQRAGDFSASGWS